ncbi:hypothetical protein RRG08_030007 [Elysia crispata]|uniref:Uncharacterized protein n=1 Tax=Elysia crispata TaxID=231223 RepID=A0AAE0XZQ7_9GAST|nr:hypothetical protein RRG08_030007 [Elysia crispata]
MTKTMSLHKVAPARCMLGFPWVFGFFRNNPRVMRRVRLNLACSSMVLLVLSVTFLLVPDQASNRSLQVDIALYKEVLALKHDSPQSVTARTAPEEAETFCQSRQRLGLSSSSQNLGAATRFDPHGLPVTSTQSTDLIQEATCVLPKLDPCDPQILPFDLSKPKMSCSSEANWVYVRNGTFRISQLATARHGKILCEHAPIVRGKGDYITEYDLHVKPILSGSPLVKDFFKVDCSSQSGHRYFNIHLGVAFNPDLHKRGETTPLPATAMGGYDVFMFGFDSVSRMSWLRNLPKTRDFFTRMLGGIEMEGHNILGDGTVQALLPLLTGQAELDLPTARRDQRKAVHVDGFPWIWQDFKKAGYVTAWGEDMSYIGTFQMRLKGFKEQPVDHYVRTYFLSAEPMYHRFRDGCAGSELRHIRFFNYFRDLYHMYGEKRKFMFGFHSELSHDDNSHLKKLDADFTQFLTELKDAGYFNQTILILMADHGSRFSDIRQTQQGKLEERLPYFSFYFPPAFKAAFPKEVEQVRLNRKRLTTMFDVHETFHDLLDNNPLRASRTKGRGISLFRPVPKSRTCEQAGIEPHWCACLNWDDVSQDHQLKAATGQVVVDFLNSLTDLARDRCEILSVQRVVSVSRFVPRKDILMFKKSADAHGDIPDLSDNMTLNFEYLQLDLVTSPGQGRFESTVKHSLDTGDFVVRADDVSRTNKYGNASACVYDDLPSLRPYCYCTHRKHHTLRRDSGYERSKT